MRMLSFSYFKNCKLKTLYSRLSRQLNTDAILAETQSETGDLSLIEVSPSWPEHEERELRCAVLRDMRVLPEFVSEQEEASMLAELEPYLKRMRYEFDHWDNAIQGYRETERSQWSPANQAVLSRVRAVAFADGGGEPLPHQHVLDLAAAGHIKPHVDAVRFCGDVIAGLCLLSSAVMRLRHAEREHLALDALLQRRALYIMKGVARYQFSHAVPSGGDSTWRGGTLLKRRRIAVITRARPRSTHTIGK